MEILQTLKYLILLKIQNMMHVKGVLLQWFINFLVKKLLVVLKNMRNQELADELNKPIIRKFEKQKVYSPFINNI